MAALLTSSVSLVTLLVDSKPHLKKVKHKVQMRQHANHLKAVLSNSNYLGATADIDSEYSIFISIINMKIQ